MDDLALATADAVLPERTALQLHLTQVIAIVLLGPDALHTGDAAGTHSLGSEEAPVRSGG